MKANCKTCKRILSYETKSCTQCGDPDPFYKRQYKSKKPFWGFLNLIIIVVGILGLAYFVGGGGGTSDYLLGIGWLAVCLILATLLVIRFQKANKQLYLKSKQLCIDIEAENQCDKVFGY